MKRALTSEILMAFRSNPGSPASPASFNDASTADKRRRVVSYEGQHQAAKALLSITASRNMDGEPVPWDPKEFFSMLRVQPGPAQDILRKPLENLCKKIAASELSHAEKQKVAQFATNAIWTMTETAEMLKVREKQPEAAMTVEAETELQANNVAEQRALALHTKICRDSIRVLAGAHRANAESQLLTRACEDKVDKLLNEVGGILVIKRADLNSRETALKEAVQAVTAQDTKLTSEIQRLGQGQSLARQNPITLCLDAVLEPTPHMAPLLAERRRLRAVQTRAEANLASTHRSSRVHEQLINVMQRAKEVLADDIRTSVQRAAAHRSHVTRGAGQTILKQIPLLAKTLSSYINFLQERNESAAKRIVAKREELAEHERLYGDEAPSELKEIKKRLAEFEGIQARSAENLRIIAGAQKELWLEGLAEAPAVTDRDAAAERRQNAPESNDPVFVKAEVLSAASRRAVLPATVIIRLQRCLVELESALADFEGVDSIRAVVREILTRSYEYCPRRTARVTMAQTKAATPAAAAVSFEVVEQKAEDGPPPEAVAHGSPRTRGLAMVPVSTLQAERHAGARVPGRLYLENVGHDEAVGRSFLDQVTEAAGFADFDDFEDEHDDGSSGGGGCLLM